ncbi:uncharacterized protein LOC62_01G001011 [Vanrija pseudolonga]|uniref:Uncharacterized protein n=1 Tax=Vanrija pseudolonga TaxID=143232 RepID=A0AAF0Y034_9TREE|nr:hypothetical protein LOC62_01G001011 [Vanrija pseudolonga]
MFESTPARSSPHRNANHSPQLFHPKPVPFARPAFTSSYSSPLLTSSGSGTSPPTAGSSSASCSPSPPSPHMKPTALSGNKHRPKMPKKMSSTSGKQQRVQLSIEVKVERSRCGFHSLFVPLGRAPPPAPPTSPVFGQSSNHNNHALKPDPAWPHDTKSTCQESWVEDVGVGQHSMEVD